MDCSDTSITEVDGISERLLSMSLDVDEEQQISEKQPTKDPRTIARKYQLDLCKRALEENIVVYLETGCGKTHIAVLLIYEMGHLIKKPQKNMCIFLAPTVALVQQVMLEMEEMPNETFEFYGEPRARKKDAAETAADAALWYLEHEGYVWDRKRDR